MNTKTLLHTAAPYLLLAVLFAVLMQQAQYGFFQLQEDAIAYVLQQLSAGVFPSDAELGTSLASAPLFVPVYALWQAVAGSSDGFMYFARLVVTALSFAVALAIYQVGSRDGYRNQSLMIAVAVMLLTSVRIMGVVLSLALVLASAAGLLVWCAFAQCLEDDGTHTGYARVLLPFFAGALLLFAFACSWVPVLLVALFLGQGMARLRAKGVSCASFVWADVGAAVALVILLMYLLGFDDPASVIGTYVRAPFSGGGAFPVVDGGLAPVSVVFYFFAVVLAFGIALAFNVNKLTEKGTSMLIAGVLVLAVVAQGIWLVSTRINNTIPLNGGPAAYLVASTEDADRYDDAKQAANAVGDDKVQVQSFNKWMPLMFQNAVTAEDPEAHWIFVANDTADEVEESGDGDDPGAARAVIMQNSAGTLYRTASKESYISQG